MKKFVASVISLTLIMTTASFGFAATDNIESTTNESSEIISDIVSIVLEPTEPNRASTNDRFNYVYETSAQKLLSTTVVTAEQVKSTNICKTISLTILGLMTPIGTGTAFAIGLASDIHALNQDGTIKAYRAVKKHIKINVVTGNRSVVGEWYIYTTKVYDKYGNLKSTRSETVRTK